MSKIFAKIRIIATGPCIANRLRDVNTICRRGWYIAAHIWKNYDFKIEVVPFIINISTEFKNDADEAVSVVSLSQSYMTLLQEQNVFYQTRNVYLKLLTTLR
jgi:hypothetical protein